MSSIDDPIEAVRMQHREQPDKILDIILEIAGKLDPFTGVVSTIKKHFSQKEAAERVMALFKAHELVIRGLGKDIKDLEDRLQSPEYIEALIVAVHESLRTSNLRKVQRFASILGYELALGKASLRTWEDAAAFIRDLAELGEADIQALKILDSVQSDLLDDEVKWPINVHSYDPNLFTVRHQRVLDLIDERGIQREEFYSRCSRLTGFGLTLEVPRNETRVAPGDYCFRLTLRGKRLLSMLRCVDDS